MATAATKETAPGTGRGWRRNALIVALLAVVVAVVAVAVAWFVPVFQVGSVEVTGNDRVAGETIEEATGVAEGENLLRVDTTEAAAGVVAHPWIAEATVTRRLPGTLAVEVVERTAVAFTEGPDGTTLIDADGTPFVIDEPPAEAVLITGEGSDDEEALAGAVDIAAALPAEVRAQVAAVEAEDAHGYTLVLHDGRQIYWGDSSDNANKALAMETVLQREGSEWDISNPNLVTVR